MDTEDIEYTLAAYALILEDGNPAEKEAGRHLIAALNKLKRKSALKNANPSRMRPRSKWDDSPPMPNRQKAHPMALLIQ